MLPDPVPRDGDWALARWGLLGERAEPVFAPGARYPLAGLLLALPALEATGCRKLSPGLEAKTVVNTHRVLHRAWEDFAVWGWAKRNVVADAHPPRVPRKGRKV